MVLAQPIIYRTARNVVKLACIPDKALTIIASLKLEERCV